VQKEKSFFNLVEKNPLNAAYQIPEKKDQLQYLKKKQIQKIWEKLVEAISSVRVIDQSKEILFTSIRFLLQDPHILAYLDEENLLTLGYRFELYRDILIALIRKNNPDPFSGFSYEIIQTGGTEQNFLYVGGFIQRCHSLPIQSIISLGSKNSQIATLILKDIGSHFDYFEISAGYLTHHPCLADQIAINWSALVQVYPLNEGPIKKMLTSLQSKYPAFNQVKLGARIQHDYPHLMIQNLPQSNVKRRVANMVGLGFLVWAASKIITMAMKMRRPIAAAVPYVAPRIVGTVIKGSVAAAAPGISAWPFVPAFLGYLACTAGARLLEAYQQRNVVCNKSDPEARHHKKS
jgi:hypothetical protein